jgi:hypothetical protein
MYLLFIWRGTSGFRCRQYPLPVRGPLEGLENRDFFGPLNGNERIKKSKVPYKVHNIRLRYKKYYTVSLVLYMYVYLNRSVANHDIQHAPSWSNSGTVKPIGSSWFAALTN